MDTICIRKFTKEYNSVKSVGEITVLVLCTSSDNTLCSYQVCKSISKGFRVTNPNTRVGASVVASVDGWTYGRTDGKPYPYIAQCLKQAR